MATGEHVVNGLNSVIGGFCSGLWFLSRGADE